MRTHYKLAVWSSAGQEVKGGNVILTVNSKIVCVTALSCPHHTKSVCGGKGGQCGHAHKFLAVG